MQLTSDPLLGKYLKGGVRRTVGVLWMALPLSFLAFAHGALPLLDAPSLAALSSLVGGAKCAADSGNIFAFTCTQLGYPIGSMPLIGYPTQVLSAFLYKYPSIPLIDGLQILTVSYTALGFLALFRFVRQNTGSRLAACTAGLIYYSSPFMVGMAGFFTTYHGFLLFPFYVVASQYLFQHFLEGVRDWSVRKLFFAACSQILIFSCAILIDGYSFVMALVVVGVFYTGFLLWPATPMSGRKRAFAFLTYGGLLVLPGVAYRSIVPAEPAAWANPIDFIRAQSIDLLTVFLPTQRWLFARVLGLGPPEWNNFAFYGDGHNANMNFLGIATLLAAVFGCVLALRQPTKARVIPILCVLVFVIGFTLSVGPSLKIYNVRESQRLTQPSYADYLMPADKATLTLPTKPLFNLPVINTMRATYRWQLITRFAVVVFVGFLIAGILHRRWLAALVIGLVIIENMPTSVLNGQHRYRLNRTQYSAFTADVVDRLRPHVKPTDRVLFLPAENDYLVSLIIPFTGGYTYNLPFDKEIARVIPLQPRLITEARRKFAVGTLTTEDVADLFRQGLVDKVIFPYFNLRWDAYWWPPSRDTIEKYRTKASSLKLSNTPDLMTVEERMFLVLERR